MVVITDVCLCSYTSHGHCGILTKNLKMKVNDPEKNRGQWTINYGLIDNDASLEILSKIALSHAESGVDIVVPSAMLDGQVKAIREMLDKNKLKDVAIMSYSAKFASNFYGSFRGAADSSPQFGDRKSYQLDYHNMKEALREVKQDIKEGTYIVMVKPALVYLDIVRICKNREREV